ncbi:MAG: hypothetical protein ACRENL_11460, partial [Candidatus Dormibacteria bacterium]
LFKVINVLGEGADDMPGLSPSDPPEPGRFQRPYLTSGHAREGGHEAHQDNQARVNSDGDTPDPAAIDRGLITEGHQRVAKSADKADAAVAPSGSSGRIYYSNAQRASAAAVMENLHDHITAVFPELCPMAPSRGRVDQIPREDVVPEAALDTSVTGEASPDGGSAPKEEVQGPAPGEKSVVAAVGKSASDIDVAALVAQITQTVTADVTKAMAATYDRRVHELEAQVEEMGREPDPRQAPFRGNFAGAVNKVAHRDPAEVQQDAETARDILALTRFAANTSDPTLRKGAMAQLATLQAGLAKTG